MHLANFFFYCVEADRITVDLQLQLQLELGAWRLIELQLADGDSFAPLTEGQVACTLIKRR